MGAGFELNLSNFSCFSKTDIFSLITVNSKSLKWLIIFILMIKTIKIVVKNKKNLIKLNFLNEL